MSIPVCRAAVFLNGLWQCLSEQKWRAWFQGQVSLVCFFVIYSDHWRYQDINSPVNTDKNPDLAHTMPVSSINKLKICCPIYLFSFWPSELGSDGKQTLWLPLLNLDIYVLSDWLALSVKMSLVVPVHQEAMIFLYANDAKQNSWEFSLVGDG